MYLTTVNDFDVEPVKVDEISREQANMYLRLPHRPVTGVAGGVGPVCG